MNSTTVATGSRKLLNGVLGLPRVGKKGAWINEKYHLCFVTLQVCSCRGLGYKLLP